MPPDLQTWIIAHPDDVSEVLGEPATGERIPVLHWLWPSRAWYSTWFGVFLVWAVFLAVLIDRWVANGPSVFVIIQFVIASVVFLIPPTIQMIRSGLLPFLYWIEWSPAGLDITLLGRTTHFPARKPIRVWHVHPIILAIRKPGSRWVPIPHAVLERIAAPESAFRPPDPR